MRESIALGISAILTNQEAKKDKSESLEINLIALVIHFCANFTG